MVGSLEMVHDCPPTVVLGAEFGADWSSGAVGTGVWCRSSVPEFGAEFGTGVWCRSLVRGVGAGVRCRSLVPEFGAGVPVPEFGAGVRCRSSVPESRAVGAGVWCRSSVPEFRAGVRCRSLVPSLVPELVPEFGAGVWCRSLSRGVGASRKIAAPMMLVTMISAVILAANATRLSTWTIGTIESAT